MLHNPKNPPRRQIYLLKRIKRENPFKITLICLKRWTDGSALPVGLRGFTSDADEVQKMPTSFNLQPWIVSWLPPSNSMTWRPEFHDSWWSTRHSCADGVQPHTALQTQPSAASPACVSPLTPLTPPYQDPGPTWFGFPPGYPFKEKNPCSNLKKELSCKSYGWGLWGHCQPTRLPQQCHTSGNPSH